MSFPFYPNGKPDDYVYNVELEAFESCADYGGCQTYLPHHETLFKAEFNAEFNAQDEHIDLIDGSRKGWWQWQGKITATKVAHQYNANPLASIQLRLWVHTYFIDEFTRLREDILIFVRNFLKLVDLKIWRSQIKRFELLLDEVLVWVPTPL